MNTKLNLLKSAIAHVEQNHEFMAYFLKEYSAIERITESDLLSDFGCSLDDYYKLALCKAPDVNDPDFILRLKRISEYINVSTARLSAVIMRVNLITKLADTSNRTFLMAARDKKEEDDH